MPTLFGDARSDAVLLKIFRDGHWLHNRGVSAPAALIRSGLVTPGQHKGRDVLVLSPQHPARRELLEVLRALNCGASGSAPSIGVNHPPEYGVDRDRPLAHPSRHAFRLLLELVRAGDEPVRVESLRWVTSSRSAEVIEQTIAMLDAAGLVTETRGFVAIGNGVPRSYRALIERLAEVLVARDPRLAPGAPAVVPRPSAFQSACDGAPRLFGSDIRLRNLMALAKHGPMYLDEVLELTGGASKKETADSAPFGRAGVVNVWSAKHGVAAQLNPAYPLVYPLRRLLLAMERQYQLPPFSRRYEMPEGSPSRPWCGDKNALFGGPLCSSILFSVGALGWTFEALCCATATGYDRVVVKKALRTLHDEGVLDSSRERRPGFDVRVVTLAQRFPARDELEMLLLLAVGRWPEFSHRIQYAVAHLPAKTRAHLENRGLPVHRSNAPDLTARGNAIGRLDCLQRYYAMSESSKRVIPSHELAKSAPGLYRAITRLWGTFATFRDAAGVPEPHAAKSRALGEELARECVEDYFAIATTLRHLPNSIELMRIKYRLYDRIRLQWGGFSHFCRALSIRPDRHWQTAKQPSEKKRMQYRAEYLALCEHIGRELSSAELRQQDFRLFRRIARTWHGFPRFRAECFGG